MRLGNGCDGDIGGFLSGKDLCRRFACGASDVQIFDRGGSGTADLYLLYFRAEYRDLLFVRYRKDVAFQLSDDGVVKDIDEALGSRCDKLVDFVSMVVMSETAESRISMP